MNQGYKRIISRYNLGGESSLYSRLTLQLSADQSICRLPLRNGQASFTLRASNEGLPKPRVARAQRPPPMGCPFLSFPALTFPQ
jgi:hypothetical protein